MTFVVTSGTRPRPGSGDDDGALASSTSAGLRIADACLSGTGPLN